MVQYIKIGKINSGHCRPNKEKRVLTLFFLFFFFAAFLFISAMVVAYLVGCVRITGLKNTSAKFLLHGYIHLF